MCLLSLGVLPFSLSSCPPPPLPPESSFDSPCAARPPSSSVGVNLSPRLSPNTELYKLKPISPPELRSSYSGHFIFVYLLSANMPGLLLLLRCSVAAAATGSDDILLARLATRQRQGESFPPMRARLYELLSVCTPRAVPV